MIFNEKTLEACRDIRSRIDSLWKAETLEEIEEVYTGCKAKINGSFFLGYLGSTNREMWLSKLEKEFVISKLILLNHREEGQA